MKIGIIGAMDEEIELIRKELVIGRIEKKAGLEFYMGELLGKETVIVRSGIGKVNAAICTQILIDDFNVDMVINTGIAGAVSQSINPGDIVVSTDLVQHDIDTSVFGDKVGQVPRMEVYSFCADKRLVEIAMDSARKIEQYNVFAGRIISGDQFIADCKKIKYFRDEFDACAVEMEGASIAHTCFVNNVPFVVIRSISDRADGSAHMDYETFKKTAISNSISILKNMISRV